MQMSDWKRRVLNHKKWVPTLVPEEQMPLPRLKLSQEFKLDALSPNNGPELEDNEWDSCLHKDIHSSTDNKDNNSDNHEIATIEELFAQRLTKQRVQKVY